MHFRARNSVCFTLGFLALLNWLLIFPACTFGQGTAFTYQGRLNIGPGPANGSYDFQFAVYDSGTNGIQQGPVLTNNATAVNNGLFTVVLDFGSQFPGTSRWLEIAVQTNGGNGFVPLSPRQPLMPVPYAITAANVVSGGLASGTYSNAIAFDNGNNVFVGNGTGLTNVIARGISGPLSGTNLPANVVTNIVLRPNGASDQTAIIQAAFSTPNSVIYFTPGSYYATNLWLTSNVTVFGNGATLSQLSVPSQIPYQSIVNWMGNTNWNALIDCGPANHNQRIYNLILDGGKPSGYQFSIFDIYTGSNHGFYSMSLCATGNFGMTVNIASGGEISGCVAQNFSGAGYLIFSSADEASYLTAQTQFHNNTALGDFLGFECIAWGYPSAYGNAEYANLFALTANDCAIGIECGQSNAKLHDSQFDNCRVGWSLQSGNGNSGPHTRYNNITLNHDYCGFFISNPDYAGIDGLYEAATVTNFIAAGLASFYHSSLSPILVTSAAYRSQVLFDGCQVAGGLTVSNSFVQLRDCLLYTNMPVRFYGGTNSCYYCYCDGFNNWNTDVVTNMGNSGVSFNYGNHQTYGPNSDGSFPQGVTTNVASSGTTFYITNGLIMRVTSP